jgi:hypothetical protein
MDAPALLGPLSRRAGAPDEESGTVWYFDGPLPRTSPRLHIARLADQYRKKAHNASLPLRSANLRFF